MHRGQRRHFRALAFYALRFPHARVGILMTSWRLGLFGRWCCIPAAYAFGIWALLQLMLAGEQLAGVGQVSGLGHLGGCLAGFTAWLAWRAGEKPPE